LAGAGSAAAAGSRRPAFSLRRDGRAAAVIAAMACARWTKHADVGCTHRRFERGVKAVDLRALGVRAATTAPVPRGGCKLSSSRRGITGPTSLRDPVERSFFTPHARGANPGGRIPRRRALSDPVMIAVDTRERYPYRFAPQGAETVRETVPAGDYAIERKSLENFAATLSDGTLAFQLQRLAELPLAAIVVEARYSALYKLEHVNGSWLADQLARLEVRYPEVHLVFADSRRFAEEWTYRFLTTALTNSSNPSPNG
jgi:ERCC4 domain-containing protein